jgi:hypothetical protein
MKVTVESENTKPEDPFKVGKLVSYMYSEKPCIILVTGVRDANFSGTLITEPDPIDLQDGLHREDWLKASFMKFTGNLIIKQ